MDPKLDKAIDELADSMREDVAMLEKFPQVTQNHYDKYLTFLTAAQVNSDNRLMIAAALIRAGANRVGVVAALKICGDL